MTKIDGQKQHWEKHVCMQCGKEFMVRKCYAKRGQGKFCSVSCSTKYRNLHNNPSKRPEVKNKISLNHADVSGSNNPMFGKKGKEAPGYIDGRNSITGDIWRKIALLNKPQACEICGEQISGRKLHIHHKDKNHNNNSLDNLQVVCVRCHNLIIHKRDRDELGRFISKEAM
jgi:hypothetical protein